MSEGEAPLSPKDLSDVFALLLVGLLGVSIALTFVGARDGVDSGVWSVLGAIGSIAQALLVGIAVIVAVRELRSHLVVADRVRADAILDQVLVVAFREILPAVLRLRESGSALSEVVRDTWSAQIGRDSPVAPDVRVVLESDYSRARVEYLGARAELMIGCTLLASYTSFATERGWGVAAGELMDVCSGVVDPPPSLGECSSSEPSRIADSVEGVYGCFSRLAAAIVELGEGEGERQ